MTSTELYVITKHGNCNYQGFKNSYRGALYVWNDVAVRYVGYDGFPHAGHDFQMEVWNYYSRHPGVMKPHEVIVLASTMDHAVVEGHRWKELVSAFAQYGKEHPESNFTEQAEAIEDLVNLIGESNVSYIAWNQNNMGNFWGIDYVEEIDEFEYYDPNVGENHFWVFEHIEYEPIGEESYVS